ncbi:hypothetical protein HORIV_25810 [Vreelandella olivaria]|uniref:Uncharacterized protein n=1 Tax=Vreelandella olivaria TaxID=390919 RepID=A0ABM7GHM6_9GAMM|nr:hypothetical protein HORIV_25810 [Halomonas olivaria]
MRPERRIQALHVIGYAAGNAGGVAAVMASDDAQQVGAIFGAACHGASLIKA